MKKNPTYESLIDKSIGSMLSAIEIYNKPDFKYRLTSSLRTPKILVKEFCYLLMPIHQHGLCIDILVQR